MALWLVLMISCWPLIGHGAVAPGFEPAVELQPPDGASGSDPHRHGGVSVPGTELAPAQPEGGTGGFRGWLADRLLGLGKGLVAGLSGAAGVVLVAAFFVTSTPVLLGLGGAALLGGALYGLLAGGRNFNWVEAIVGAVLSGASAGVGQWLTVASRPLAAKIGVVAADLMAGGIAGLTSYLVHSPERSWRGAVWAFGLGGLASAFFTGLGAVTSRFWTWGQDLMSALLDRQPNPKAVVAAALEPTSPRATSVGETAAAAGSVQEALQAPARFAANLPGDIARIGSSAYARALGFKRFTKNNYRKALIRHSGIGNPGPDVHAHHVFPQELERNFMQVFKDLDFSIHDPRFMAWWDRQTHLKFKGAYHEEWRAFLSQIAHPTPEEVFDQAIRIMTRFEKMARSQGGTIWTSPNSMFGDRFSGKAPFMSTPLTRR